MNGVYPSSNGAANGAARVAKLLAYALDANANPAEAENAACMMVRTARAGGVGFTDLAASFAIVKFTKPEPAEVEEPPACEVEIDFGKYRGETLEWVARHDLGYLRWLATKIENRDDIRDAAGQVLAYFRGRS